MLESITLKDFISHRDTTIRFGDGLTVFIGRNGSGKSSVIDAVTYALYGKHTRSSNRNLVRHSAKQSSIVLEFSIESRRYRVEKRLNQRGNLEGAVLYEWKDSGWKAYAAGERRQFDESMSAEISNILGLDYDKMRVAAIIQQGEIDRIVEYKPKELKELINSIIGIDRLDNAYSLMRDVTDGFRERLRKVYGYDDTSIETLSKYAERYASEIEETEHEIARVEEEIRRIVEMKAPLAREYEVMRQKREMFERLKVHAGNLVSYMQERKRSLEKEVADLRATLNRAEEYLDLVEQEESTKVSIDYYEERVRELDDEVGRLRQEHAMLEARRHMLEERSRLLSNIREQLMTVQRLRYVPDELSRLRNRLEEVNNSISSMNEELGRLKGLIECVSRLEFKDNVCPVCGSRVERINPLFERHSLEKHVKDLTEHLRRLSSERSDLQNRLRRLEKDNSDLHKAEGFLSMHGITSMDDLSRLEEEVSAIRKEVEDIDPLKKRIGSLLDERRNAENELARYRRRLDEINRAKAFLDTKGIVDRVAFERFKAALKENESLLSRLSVLAGNDVHAVTASIIAEPDTADGYAIDDFSRALIDEMKVLADGCRGFSEDRYSMLEEELKRIEEAERERERELAVPKSRLVELKGELERLRQTLGVLEHAREQINILNRIRENVFYRDGPVARSLRSWALQHISEKASEYARIFSMGISRIELREEREGKNEISMSCYGTRGLIDVESMSGGEKVAVALTLRLAMAHLMGSRKIDFIIMDEPTVHLDEEKRRTMVELIGRLARNSPLRQMIIITHDSEIFEDADVDHLYRFEMTDEGSVVSEVR